MERFNIFNLIHKGLRASLYQTALQLQQTDFSSEQETEAALDRVKEIVMLFDGHGHKEDTYVLSAINDFEPSVVATLEAEHVQDEALGRQLTEAIERQQKAVTLIEKITMGARLAEAFIEFMVFNLNHMAKEEDIVNKALWRYYSDDEIRKINGQILANTPPWIQSFYLTWMLRGINDNEAIGWMQAIERNMPPVVFQTLLQKAEEEWPANRFRKVTASLSTRAQAA